VPQMGIAVGVVNRCGQEEFGQLLARVAVG
jgi:hypothetical protein